MRLVIISRESVFPTSFASIPSPLFWLQVKHCKQELRIPGNKASMLYTYMGITSFISRHLFCKLGDLKYLNRFHLYQGGMTISGLCVLCLPLARSFGSIAAIFTVFGLMDGAMNGQYALLLLECTGRRQANRAWGYMMLFSGLSVGLGSPLAGELYCSGFNICLPDW